MFHVSHLGFQRATHLAHLETEKTWLTLTQQSFRMLIPRIVYKYIMEYTIYMDQWEYLYIYILWDFLKTYDACWSQGLITSATLHVEKQWKTLNPSPGVAEQMPSGSLFHMALQKHLRK
jgi:hypothetical protein